MFQMQAGAHWLLHNAQTSVKAVEGSQWPPAAQVKLNPASQQELFILTPGAWNWFWTHLLSTVSFFWSKERPLMRPNSWQHNSSCPQQTDGHHGKAAVPPRHCQDTPLGWGWEGQGGWDGAENRSGGVKVKTFQGKSVVPTASSGEEKQPQNLQSPTVHTKGANEKGRHLLVWSLLQPC